MFCAVCCHRFSSQMANRPYLSKGCDFFPPSGSAPLTQASSSARLEAWTPPITNGPSQAADLPTPTEAFTLHKQASSWQPLPTPLPRFCYPTWHKIHFLIYSVYFFSGKMQKKCGKWQVPFFFCTFFFTSYIFAPPLLPRPQPVFVFECVSTPQLSIRLRVKKMDARVTFCLVRRRVSTSPNWSTLECCDTAAVVGRPIGSKGSQRERSGSTGGRQDQHRIYMFVVFFPFLPPSLLVSWVCLMPSDDSEQHLQEISIPFPVIPWTRAGIPLDTRREIKSATSQR